MGFFKCNMSVPFNGNADYLELKDDDWKFSGENFVVENFYEHKEWTLKDSVTLLLNNKVKKTKILWFIIKWILRRGKNVSL